MFEWLGWFGVPWLRNLLSHGCTSAQHLDGSGTLKPASSHKTEREMTRKRKMDVINKRQALWMSINAHVSHFVCTKIYHWFHMHMIRQAKQFRNKKHGNRLSLRPLPVLHPVLWYLGTSGCSDQLQNILVNWKSGHQPRSVRSRSAVQLRCHVKKAQMSVRLQLSWWKWTRRCYAYMAHHWYFTTKICKSQSVSCHKKIAGCLVVSILYLPLWKIWINGKDDIPIYHGT